LAQALFEGGLRRALTEGARAAYDGKVATYRQTVLLPFPEGEDDLATLPVLQEEAVRPPGRAVKLAINQYKAGTISYLNVIVTQGRRFECLRGLYGYSRPSHDSQRTSHQGPRR